VTNNTALTGYDLERISTMVILSKGNGELLCMTIIYAFF